MQRLSSSASRFVSTRMAAVLVAALVAADVGGFVVVGKRVQAVTVDQAVERFRDQKADRFRDQEAESVSDSASGATQGAPTDEGGAQTAASASGGLMAAAAAPGAGPRSVASSGTKTTAPAPAASTAGLGARPAEGVYVYATQGSEQIDILDTRHDYPDETTMTLTHTACGLDLRWDALKERWSQWQHCTPGRVLTLKRFTSHHEFFGQVNERDFSCGPATVFRPESTKAGDRFSGKCTTEDGSAVEMDGRVVGVENMAVGGRTVEAVRVRVDEKLTGHTRGTRVSESWYAVADGLLLKRASQTDAQTEATFGKTHYVEDVTVTLRSLMPRR